jgi:hypothetical protein
LCCIYWERERDQKTAAARQSSAHFLNGYERRHISLNGSPPSLTFMQLRWRYTLLPITTNLPRLATRSGTASLIQGLNNIAITRRLNQFRSAQTTPQSVFNLPIVMDVKKSRIIQHSDRQGYFINGYLMEQRPKPFSFPWRPTLAGGGKTGKNIRERMK